MLLTVIEDDGSASEASSRRVGGLPEQSGDCGFASLVIDPMDILGEKGGQFERCEGAGFFDLARNSADRRTTVSLVALSSPLTQRPRSAPAFASLRLRTR